MGYRNIGLTDERISPIVRCIIECKTVTHNVYSTLHR